MNDEAVTDWGQLDDAEMGARIAALGPAVEPTDIDLVVRLRTAIDSTTPRRVGRRRPLAVAAALTLLAGILVLSIAPARTAVANWLGIGNTSVVIVDDLPPAEPATPPSTPPSALPSPLPSAPPVDEGWDSGSIRLAAAEQLDISVQLPAPELVGAPGGWEIRDTGDGEELVVAWERITLTARARSAGAPQQKIITAFDAVSTVGMAPLRCGSRVSMSVRWATWLSPSGTRFCGRPTASSTGSSVMSSSLRPSRSPVRLSRTQP